jgi:activator of HSP90 ATPase
MSSWAKSKLETLFKEIVTSFQNSELSGTIKIDEICDISGDASIAVVRGAKRFIFDFSFKLRCSLHLDNNAEPVQGELRFLDMSSDCGRDYDVRLIRGIVCISINFDIIFFFHRLK